MVKLEDYLINDQDFTRTIEIKVHCDGGEIIFGVRDSKGITWQEKKKLANEYYDMDLENRTAQVNLEKGDMARYLAFIKYVRDDSGQRNLMKKDIMALPTDMLEQIEQHIPSMQDVIEGISKSIKKKSET